MARLAKRKGPGLVSYKLVAAKNRALNLKGGQTLKSRSLC